MNWGRSLGWNIELQGYKKRKMEYSIITNGCDCYPWHEVFALWPIKTVSGKRIWWRKVFKRKVWVVWGTGFHMEPEVQYATAFDLLDEQYRKLTQ
jgi:hypothetical protein